MSQEVRLTDEQVAQLRDRLCETRGNVYQIARSMFGVEVGEEVFDQLKAAGMEPCGRCDTWTEVGNMSAELTDYCLDCAEEI